MCCKGRYHKSDEIEDDKEYVYLAHFPQSNYNPSHICESILSLFNEKLSYQILISSSHQKVRKHRDEE